MVFTKHTWSPGDRIYATTTPGNLDNIEDGLDEMYNLPITFLKNKKLLDGARLNQWSAFMQLRNAGATRMSSQPMNSLYTAVFDDWAGVSKSVYFDNDVHVGQLNRELNVGAYPELHGSRHGELLATWPYKDFVPMVADVVVAQAGDGGHFTDIASAVSTLSVGEVLGIRAGEFDVSAQLDLPAKSTIFGSGERTIINATHTDEIFEINSNNVTIRDIQMQNLNSGFGLGYVLRVDGSDCYLDNIRIFSHHAGIALNGPRSVARGCRVENVRTSSVTYGGALHASLTKFIGCEFKGFRYGVSQLGEGSQFIGNHVHLNLSSAWGIWFRNTALSCLAAYNLVSGTMQYGVRVDASSLGGGKGLVKGNFLDNGTYNGDPATTELIDNYVF